MTRCFFIKCNNAPAYVSLFKVTGVQTGRHDHGYSVLIADDEPNQLELLSYNLSQSKFEVIRANDGQQALEMIEGQHPDLVILDWMMPNMSGIDVCRTLRSRSETKLLPVILLSARGEEGDRTLGLDVGADDYISKPFSPAN